MTGLSDYRDQDQAWPLRKPYVDEALPIMS